MIYRLFFTPAAARYSAQVYITVSPEPIMALATSPVRGGLLGLHAFFTTL